MVRPAMLPSRAMTIPEAFQIALQHHQARRLGEAEAIYRQILAADSRHQDALHLLGVIAHQVGQKDLAVDLIRQAVNLNPNIAAFHFNLGLALQARGQFDEAIAAYRRSCQLDPSEAKHHCNLGFALWNVGELDEAITESRLAIQRSPDFVEAHNNLGNALRDKGQIDEAIAAYLHALKFSPAFAEIHNNLGNALRDKGRITEAIAAYRRSIELKPDYAEAHNNLGNAVADQGRLEEAIVSYRRAIELKPGYTDAHCNLGNALKDQGLLPEAIAEYRRAVELKPDFAAAHSNLGNALKEEAQLDGVMECYRKAVTLKPKDTLMHSNMVYTALFHPGYDTAALRGQCEIWEALHGEPRRKWIRPHANDRDPERRLRVGYVSPNLSRHVIHHFLLPLLEGHDHAAFEIFCYASVKVPDAVTERMKKSADVWRDVFGLAEEAMAEQIREDKIDILVDLTQHMADNRLAVFARKPAPVQVAWLGYPGSTGLRTMDYRLTDAWMEPEGSEWSESVEEVVRLPDSWFCFDPVDEYPELAEPPALKAGHVTFGCLNTFCKVNDAVLERWAVVMRAVENSRLLLRCPQGAAQARVREFFAARGIASERVELFAWAPSRADFLKLFDRMDIALDPFPYNGGTTTCEALWMGIPVLTLPGEGIVARIGLSILMACGMPEFVAHTEADYVQLAADLAADLPRLAELRATLRGRMKASAFMDGPRFAKNVEQAYRQMWRKWCAKKTAPVS